MELRCFIAIAIPETVRKEIREFTEPLRAARSDVRWVSADNLHITLKFLGATDETKIGPMTEAIRKQLCYYHTFYIRIAGTGCFPSERRPKVIWVGLSDHDSLSQLRRDIDELMTTFGYAPEGRPFSPHVTIGRVKPPGKIGTVVEGLSAGGQKNFGTFGVSGIRIMKSDLTPSGAVYTILSEIPFGGEEDT